MKTPQQENERGNAEAFDRICNKHFDAMRETLLTGTELLAPQPDASKRILVRLDPEHAAHLAQAQTRAAKKQQRLIEAAEREQREIREEAERAARLQRLSTMTLDELFLELEKHCIGYAGAVYRLDRNNKLTHFVTIGGESGSTAADFIRGNFAALKEIAYKGRGTFHSTPRKTGLLQLALDYWKHPKPPVLLAEVLRAIETAGLASIVAAIDFEATPYFAGNAVDVLGGALKVYITALDKAEDDDEGEEWKKGTAEDEE